MAWQFPDPKVLDDDKYNWDEAFKISFDSTMVCPPMVDMDCSSPILTEDVAMIIACREGENDEMNWELLGQLKDERFFYLSAGCDYTGWDCQAGGAISVGYSLKAVMQYGMTKSNAADLGLLDFYEHLERMKFLEGV